jgi:hypothetical protein
VLIISFEKVLQHTVYSSSNHGQARTCKDKDQREWSEGDASRRDVGVRVGGNAISSSKKTTKKFIAWAELRTRWWSEGNLRAFSWKPLELLSSPRLTSALVVSFAQLASRALYLLPHPHLLRCRYELGRGEA